MKGYPYPFIGAYDNPDRVLEAMWMNFQVASLRLGRKLPHVLAVAPWTTAGPLALGAAAQENFTALARRLPTPIPLPYEHLADEDTPWRVLGQRCDSNFRALDAA